MDRKGPMFAQRTFLFGVTFVPELDYPFSFCRGFGFKCDENLKNAVFSANFHRFLTKTWNNHSFSLGRKLAISCNEGTISATQRSTCSC